MAATSEASHACCTGRSCSPARVQMRHFSSAMRKRRLYSRQAARKSATPSRGRWCRRRPAAPQAVQRVQKAGVRGRELLPLNAGEERRRRAMARCCGRRAGKVERRKRGRRRRQAAAHHRAACRQRHVRPKRPSVFHARQPHARRDPTPCMPAPATSCRPPRPVRQRPPTVQMSKVAG